MPTTAARRTLDVRHARPGHARGGPAPGAGHTTVGNWSLGQICNHLTKALTASVDGYPVQGPVARSARRSRRSS